MKDIVRNEINPPSVLAVEKLSFEKVPNQSRLFLDYLKNPASLTAFYPSAVNTISELANRAPEVLANFTTDRNELSNILRAMNKKWNAPAQTLANIERLRENDAVAVVTGQQAGLFTGALYTIYKALTILKTAEKLRSQNINAVPIFWIASEDHDFAEIAKTFVQNGTGVLSEIKIETASENENLPIGKIKLGKSINTAIEQLLAELPKTEFSDDLENLIRDCYQPDSTVSDAFGNLLTQLLGSFGLILLDPLDENLKKLAAPIYKNAVANSAEITKSLTTQSRELKNAGYHAQVLVEDNSFPLFWIDENGARLGLKVQGSKFKVQSTGREFELSELQEIALESPSRLSPNATLRAVVQDFLLPTLCYFGGAAEIAYFGQTAEVSRILQRPITPIFHRASVSVVEPNVRRTLEKYDLKFTDFFAKPEMLQAGIVEQFLNNEVSKIFAETEEIINAELNRLDKNLLPIEPTLSENLAKRRRKILYHIGAMRTKFYRAEMRKNETVNRRLETAVNLLYPHQGLQERTLNITSLLARHGEKIIGWIYEAIDVDAPEHQIIRL